MNSPANATGAHASDEKRDSVARSAGTATEGVIDGLIFYQRLTETEAADPDRVAAEMAKLGQAFLLWFGKHWRELDRSTGIEILPIRISRGPSETERCRRACELPALPTRDLVGDEAGLHGWTGRRVSRRPLGYGGSREACAGSQSKTARWP